MFCDTELEGSDQGLFETQPPATVRDKTKHVNPVNQNTQSLNTKKGYNNLFGFFQAVFKATIFSGASCCDKDTQKQGQ